MKEHEFYKKKTKKRMVHLSIKVLIYLRNYYNLEKLMG